MKLPDLSLLLVVAIFWATYWVLRTWVFKPLGGILEKREEKLDAASRSLERALEEQKDGIAKLEGRLTDARRESMAVRERSSKQAAEIRQARVAESREKIRTAAAAAQLRLDAEIIAAREELREGARAVADELVEAVLGRKVA
jgi:F-type H+-transporting ATPase subunit b